MADDTQDVTPASPFTQVPIEITISVGMARPTVRELLRLKNDSILPLDKKVDDPVELYVGDKLIARGELEEIEGDPSGQLAVRLTEVADLTSGL
ncbi:FliM/FliN family flagellar motor C-terminal domain-containing protein [Aliiroseovarius sp. KMU-50]|uniref:Flagellar motor switch protein FliN n=1 Tax=Aliiroseovarius salicola TaxID=3009082 RepID=A0ABT4VYM0_9RHOB|nr:FliM/FliN family flagellar motor C-terminal domain-containing protein [Aliiroseovarius sp. KMU-50]MDA5092830.1 FliM/FliN family flagellar motor C-terminal domain-containing protein [Aliiroseovarius sp. KMU-50]